MPSVSWSADDPEALLRRGQITEALRAAAARIEADPDDIAAQELMIDVMLNVGRQPVAESRAQAQVRNRPRDPNLHYLLGRARVDPVASQQAYEAALHLEPGHARSHMGMGSVHEVNGRFDDAAAAYARAVSMDASLGEAWYGHARVVAGTGDAALALTIAREGVAAVPAEVSLALLVAQLDPANAVAVLETSLAVSGSDPQVHEALASSLLLVGDGAGALAQADAALALLPSLIDARRTRLFALEIVGGVLPPDLLSDLDVARSLEGENPAEARTKLDALVARAPRSAMVRLARAAAHRSAGDSAAELDDLSAAAALDPANDEVAAVLGLALLRAGRGAEAVGPLTVAMGERPGDATLGLALSQALSAAGHDADARLLLERVAGAHPQNVDVQLAYAQILVEAQYLPRAYGVLKVAMQLVPDPRLVAAFIRVAPLAGHADEAAAILAPLAEQSGSADLAEAVRQLRGMDADGRFR